MSFSVNGEMKFLLSTKQCNDDVNFDIVSLTTFEFSSSVSSTIVFSFVDVVVSFCCGNGF